MLQKSLTGPLVSLWCNGEGMKCSLRWIEFNVQLGDCNLSLETIAITLDWKVVSWIIGGHIHCGDYANYGELLLIGVANK